MWMKEREEEKAASPVYSLLPSAEILKNDSSQRSGSSLVPFLVRSYSPQLAVFPPGLWSLRCLAIISTHSRIGSDISTPRKFVPGKIAAAGSKP